MFDAKSCLRLPHTLTLFLFAAAIAHGYSFVGTGTEQSPWRIQNIGHMIELANAVNNGEDFFEKFFLLENDLDFSQAPTNANGNFTPIGYAEENRIFRGFDGTFDGNGKTISNITYTSPSGRSAGIFGFTQNDAIIKDLKVTSCIFNGDAEIGGVVGRNRGIVENVQVDNTTIGTSTDSRPYAHGGIVGTNESGKVRASISKASVECPTGKICDYFGGIAGNNSSGLLRYNLYLGTQVEGSSYVGWIVGQMASGQYESNFYPFALGAGGKGSSGSAIGTDVNGFRAQQTVVSDNSSLTLSLGTPAFTYSNGIAVYDWGLKYDGQTYINPSSTFTLIYNGSDFFNGYSCSGQGCSVSGSILTVGISDDGITHIDVISGGSGTESDPYLIANATTWNQFAQAVNNGNSFTGKFLKLTDDFVVTTMVGNLESAPLRSFSGTFDGDGHTLTLAYGSENEPFALDEAAPFRLVKGATIKNLHTNGAIYTSHPFAAGIVAHILKDEEHNRTTTIDNCRSSVSINAVFSGTNNGHLGGLVAYNTGATTVISNSYFDGSLYGANSQKNGGLVGYIDNQSSVEISNSLFNPENVTVNATGSKTLYWSEAGYNIVTCTGCYYTALLGDAQGTQLFSNVPADAEFLAKQITAIDNNPYYISATSNTVTVEPYYTVGSTPITPLPTSVKFDNTAMTAETDYTVKYRAEGSDVETSNISTAGNYTMVIHGTGIYAGKTTASIYVMGGEGTEASPYLIATTDDWNHFAQMVNSGKTFDGEIVKLTNDIAVSTTVSDGDSHPFMGTFNGDNHTITANIEESEGKKGAALFRYISGATIKNLTVAGSITGDAGDSHSAGLVGFAWSGTNTIENVTVAANIIGGKFVGGIVAHGKTSSLTLTNCVFSGEISGGSEYAGGLLGWTGSSTLNISNCLFKGTYTGGGKFHPVAVRSSGKNVTTSVNHCYYTVNPVNITSDYIAATGILVYLTPKENSLSSKVLAADGITYFTYPNTNTISVNDAYEIGASAITPMPASVVYNGTTLTAGVDYTVKYKAQGSNEEIAGISTIGYYTMVIYGAGNYAGSMQTQAFQVIKELQGDGSEDHPYEIASEDDWNSFAYKVNHGKSFEGEFVVLTEDIIVSTMVGDYSNSKAFKGTFSGNDANNRPTITVVYGSFDSEFDKLYAAPFRYIDGATIKDLQVTGHIYTSKPYAAGIAGYVDGTSHIDNCRSNVAIHSSYTKGSSGGYNGGYNGGLVAEMYSSTTLIIQNSIFDGALYGSNTKYNRGFVGNMFYGNLTISNSLFDPSEITMSALDGATFYPPYSHGNVTFTNCYYVKDFGTLQGTKLYVDASANTLSKKFTAIGNKTYHLYPTSNTVTMATYYEIVGNNTITPAPTSVDYDGEALTAGRDYTIGYIAEGSNVETESISLAGQYTMVIHGIGDYSGTKTQTILVIQGDGSEEHPYEIATESDWNLLAQEVNAGTTFSEKFFKLTANIGISTMVGNSTYSFAGTFDGHGHTITVTIGSEQSRFSENYVAPFRYVNGATITNLHTAGTIYTSKQFAAGIAGYVIGNATFEGCHSNVTINSSVNGDGTHGGLVARIQGTNVTISIKDSYFDGSILGTSTHSVGGLVGWIEDGQKVDFTNCLFNPQSITVKSDGGRTLARARKYENLTFTDCYYTRSIGTAQGTLVYAARETSPFLLKMENAAADGNFYYTQVAASIGGVNPNYDKGTLISAITPSVTISDQPLVQGTDFIVRISKDGNVVSGALNEDGEHTLTILGIGNYSGSVSTTFWVIHDLDGQGTKNDPYIIANANDWDSFAQKVSNGTTFGGQFVKLEADIEVYTMAGNATGDNRFHGTFDGDNHTITVHYGTTQKPVGNYAAPFSHVTSGTIKNLQTSGEIVTNGKFVGGIMGRTTGTVTIDHCRSDVSITKTNNGDGSNGGLVGIASKDRLTISNSIFSGSFAREGETKSAGFVGWIEDAVVTLNNCLLNPTSIANSILTSGQTFARPKIASNLTLNNCYYTNSAIFNTSQGDLVSATIPQNGIYKAEQITAADGNPYYVLPTITGIKDKFSFQDFVGFTPVITLNGSALAEGTDYTLTLPTIEGNGEYQITITGTGAFTGTYTKSIWIYGKFNGDGTEGNPYIIATTDDWNSIVQMVKEGETFNGLFLKMGDDISVTQMIGSDTTAHYFAGTFDGDGHILTINFGSSSNPLTANYAGPFRFIKGATIKKMDVKGNVHIRTSGSDNNYTGTNAAGLVGLATGNCLMTNNRISATITTQTGLTYAGGSHSGIIGGVGAGASITIKDCVFNGSLLKTSGNISYNAGFIGWVDGNATQVTIENSLFDPASVYSSAYSHPFNRGKPATITNSYYTSTILGTDQGIDGTNLSSTELATLLGRTWHVVDGKAVPFYNYSETLYGAVAVAIGDDSTKAYIDGSYTGEGSVDIQNDIAVDAVVFNRTFTEGKFSTIVLPFSIARNKVEGAEFYTISNITKVGDSWKNVEITKVAVDDEIAANTPYLLNPTAETLEFQGAATLNTSNITSPTFGDNNEWTFHGTYSYFAFGEHTEILGKAYGFAAKEQDGYTVGQFAKAGSGAWIPAMRAYLVYNSGNANAKSAMGGSSLEELPEAMDVVIVDRGENGEVSKKVIGTLDTRTGEFRMDRWYDMQGRKLNGKPTAKGTYYHNGKAVVVK